MTPPRITYDDRWNAVDLMASRHHGLITHPELLACGFSQAAIGRAVHSRRLVPVFPRVYRTAGSPVTPQQTLLAAVITTSPGSAASHRSGCHLWDVDVPGAHRFDFELPIEVTIPRVRSTRPSGIIVHRSLDLTEAHILVRDGIRVTNPLRLLADLGAVATKQEVKAVFTQMQTRRLVTFRGTQAFLSQIRGRGRRGAGVLAAVLAEQALRDRPGDSVFEEEFAQFSARHNLPTPVFQYPILLDGHQRYIDFAYPDAKVAIETDGWETHGTFDAFHSDRARTVDLAALGWRVLPITWRAFKKRPLWVAERIEQTLMVAAAA